MSRRAATALLALLLAACSHWVPIGTETRYVDADGRYRVELPRDWVRRKGEPDFLWLTRDGLALEQIIVFVRPLAKAFPLAKQAIKPGMLEHQIADLQLGEFKREGETLAVARVVDRAAANVGGAAGFRLQLEWINDDGLAMARVAYGAVIGKHYLLVGFEAPRLHYFDKHLPAFEAMVASLRIPASAPARRDAS